MKAVCTQPMCPYPQRAQYRLNPFDVEGMAEAILRGLNMPVGERKERWVAMMKILERNDITAWRERFVRALSVIDARH